MVSLPLLGPTHTAACPQGDLLCVWSSIEIAIRKIINKTSYTGSQNSEPLRMRYTGSCVSLTIGDQNAIKSCRWSSNFYLIAVL